MCIIVHSCEICAHAMEKETRMCGALSGGGSRDIYRKIDKDRRDRESRVSFFYSTVTGRNTGFLAGHTATLHDRCTQHHWTTVVGQKNTASATGSRTWDCTATHTTTYQHACWHNCTATTLTPTVKTANAQHSYTQVHTMRGKFRNFPLNWICNCASKSGGAIQL